MRAAGPVSRAKRGGLGGNGAKSCVELVLERGALGAGAAEAGALGRGKPHTGLNLPSCSAG